MKNGLSFLVLERSANSLKTNIQSQMFHHQSTTTKATRVMKMRIESRRKIPKQDTSTKSKRETIEIDSYQNTIINYLKVKMIIIVFV